MSNVEVYVEDGDVVVWDREVDDLEGWEFDQIAEWTVNDMYPFLTRLVLG